MQDTPLTAIAQTRIALEENASDRWVLGFSGGKDSTALPKIFCSAYRKAKRRPEEVDIIYCDTGVENIVLDRYVKSLLSCMRTEFEELGFPFRVNLLRAPVADQFFVKIIGRGYPPPTNSFRWCTKNLRIRPVQKFIGQAATEDAIVALGLRQDESVQRDRSLNKNGGGRWQAQREGRARYRMFLPILGLDLANVWDAVFMLPTPRSIEPGRLERIYRGASGECPVIKPPNAPPCASGRFGCWTCTVVRRDKSAESMVQAGDTELLPFLEFRNWLSVFRNDHSKRWPTRRRGTNGPGPFTLAARAEILERLEDLEMKSGIEVLRAEERVLIAELWREDEDIERERLAAA